MGEDERTKQNDEPDGERTKTEERPQQGPGGRAASRPPLWGTAPHTEVHPTWGCTFMPVPDLHPECTPPMGAPSCRVARIQ